MARKRKRQASFKDHQDALREAVDALPPVTVIHGDEEYLRGRAVHALLTSLHKHHPHIDELIFHGPASANEPALDLDAMLNEITSKSLFASEKAICLRQADLVLFPRGAQKEAATSTTRARSPLDRFAELLGAPPEGIWLIIESETLNRQFKLGKTLAAMDQVVPCPRLRREGDVAAWLNREARRLKKTLEPGVAELLFTAHGDNLGALAAEIEKLGIYVGDHETVTIEDVQAFLSGSVEFDIFELTNAVEARDLSRALSAARRVIDQGTRDARGKRSDSESSAHRALAMLSTSIENLLIARVTLSGGGGEAEVASAIGTSPWRAGKLMQAARSHSLQQLRHAVDQVSTAIHGSHDTGGDVRLSLEKAVLAACETPAG